MTARPFFLLLATLALLAIAVPADAQTDAAVFPDENGEALAGVNVVDARARILAWLGMPGERDQLESNVQSAFELGLRRDGLRVEASAPNYLFCELKFAHASGLIAYTFEVRYYSFETVGVHSLLWETGGIVTVGEKNFTYEDAAKTCNDAYANEWLRYGGS